VDHRLLWTQASSLLQDHSQDQAMILDNAGTWVSVVVVVVVGVLL
jgi:hypothetical protein